MVTENQVTDKRLPQYIGKENPFYGWHITDKDPVNYNDAQKRGLMFVFGAVRQISGIDPSPLNRYVSVYQKPGDDPDTTGGDFVVVSRAADNPNDLRIFDLTNEYYGDPEPPMGEELIRRVLEMADTSGMMRNRSTYGKLIETAEADPIKEAFFGGKKKGKTPNIQVVNEPVGMSTNFDQKVEVLTGEDPNTDQKLNTSSTITQHKENLMASTEKPDDQSVISLVFQKAFEDIRAPTQVSPTSPKGGWGQRIGSWIDQATAGVGRSAAYAAEKGSSVSSVQNISPLETAKQGIRGAQQQKKVNETAVEAARKDTEKRQAYTDKQYAAQMREKEGYMKMASTLLSKEKYTKADTKAVLAQQMKLRGMPQTIEGTNFPTGTTFRSQLTPAEMYAAKGPRLMAPDIPEAIGKKAKSQEVSLGKTSYPVYPAKGAPTQPSKMAQPHVKVAAHQQQKVKATPHQQKTVPYKPQKVPQPKYKSVKK